MSGQIPFNWVGSEMLSELSPEMGGVLWNEIGGRQSVGALLNLILSGLRGQVKIADMKFKKGT